MCLLTTPNIYCFLVFEYVCVVSSNTCAIEKNANEWFLILHVFVIPGQCSLALGRACACHTRMTRVSHSTVCPMLNVLYANCTMRPTGTVHTCMCIYGLRLTLSCVLLSFV